jgi:hypothetical protein
MTTAPATAGRPGRDDPGRDDLTARIFRALYQEFDLRTINGTYVVVPKGTPWFTGTSLGDIARQISDSPGQVASSAGPGKAPQQTSQTHRPRVPTRSADNYSVMIPAQTDRMSAIRNESS